MYIYKDRIFRYDNKEKTGVDFYRIYSRFASWFTKNKYELFI